MGRISPMARRRKEGSNKRDTHNAASERERQNTHTSQSPTRFASGGGGGRRNLPDVGIKKVEGEREREGGRRGGDAGRIIKADFPGFSTHTFKDVSKASL